MDVILYCLPITGILRTDTFISFELRNWLYQFLIQSMAASAMIMRPDIFSIKYHVKTSRLNKRQWKECIHLKLKQELVQFWKIVCCRITIFSRFLFGQSWLGILSDLLPKKIATPCYGFMGPSNFWCVSPLIEVYLIAILNQLSIQLGPYNTFARLTCSAVLWQDALISKSVIAPWNYYRVM